MALVGCCCVIVCAHGVLVVGRGVLGQGRCLVGLLSSARSARGRAGGGVQVVMLMVRRWVRMVVKVLAHGQRVGRCRV